MVSPGAALVSAGLFLLSRLTYMNALQNPPVTVVVPIFSTTLLFSGIFGVLFLYELISRIPFLSSVLVLAGVAVIAQG